MLRIRTESIATQRLALGRPRTASRLVAACAAIGVLFLVIKSHEYAVHFSEGIFPGGRGAFFDHAPAGSAIFFTLYFAMTGLHAVHVSVGIVVLGYCFVQLRRGRLAPHALEVAFEKSATAGLPLPGRKGRLWDLFMTHHAKLAHDVQEDFNKVFGRDFMAAYQDHLRRIKGGL